MNDEIISFIRSATSASSITVGEKLQELWSGYGSIIRIHLDLPDKPTVILKSINPPLTASHPRGWNTGTSHERKLRSYEVEACFYQCCASQTGESSRIPEFLGYCQQENSRFILLEDLDTLFPRRCEHLTVEQVAVCLDWLANFHATHMGSTAEGLWPVGTYWHLGTRRDEFVAMADGAIKRRADDIDRALNQCRYQTLVHGDAKIANFCFSDNLTTVAAVDFQYVGGGCGMKDIVYFLGSCLPASDCEKHEQRLLECYFGSLSAALAPRMSDTDIVALETEWKSLYAIAWTDFYRFLMGWMPDHPKINPYTRRLAERAMGQLDSCLS